jgi:hypothetical protein
MLMLAGTARALVLIVLVRELYSIVHDIIQPAAAD